MRLALLLCALCCTGTLVTGTGGSRLPDGPPGEPDRDPGLGLGVDVSAPLRRVDPRFLSVTIDASLASQESFVWLLSSRRMRTLAAALSPAFLRFGGTRQDFMVFEPHRRQQWEEPQDAAGKHDHLSCDQTFLPPWMEERLKCDWAKQKLVLMKEDLLGTYRSFFFTELTVDQLHAFANCSGFQLIFGLNALLRTADNSWNNSNAALLLQYCQSRHYGMSWELGNEPNSFEKKAGIRVDGHQLGLDFIRLRKMMSESKLYQDAGLYGPDVGQPRNHHVALLDGFLQTGAEAIDACTWHHYYVNGRDTSVKDFLDPEVLDSLALKTNEVMKVTLSGVSGKVGLLLLRCLHAGNLCRWLDKLGLGAALGLDIVMRQVLIGSGSYHLVDDNLDPLPDYWLSVLYKRLVGLEVLKIQVLSEFGRSKRVRMYLHCTNRKSYRRGAVTLMSMNLGKTPARISVPAVFSNSTVEAFVLESEQPGEEGLYSRSVKLNGEVLMMVDDKTLPELKGKLLLPARHLQLPAYSLAFFVLPDAQAPACS
uniref:Heparanase n=1 Tax=Maylandia zebra TaxID=106582 RepID=A0A3P9DAS1_9CICH